MIEFVPVPYLRCPTRVENQIDLVMLAAKLAAVRRPAWWQWSVWMAAAATVKRIEGNGE